MERDDRIKWAVFQGASTYQNDYRKPGFTVRVDGVWPRATVEPTQRPSRRKKSNDEFVPLDMGTLMPWRKGVHVPFNLFHYRKDVIGENPAAKIRMPEPIVDKEKDESIKTRPRIYMKSAVSMDDVPDPEMRNFLCDAVYTTDWRVSEKEAAGPINYRPVAQTVKEDKNSFKVDFQVIPNLPEGWRTGAEQWDRPQTRTYGNRDVMFWNTTDLPTQNGCAPTTLVPDSKKQEIRKLIAEDNLRLAHDFAKPGYTGYMPNLSYGIPLRKSHEAITHPMLSTSQAITKRYAEDSIGKNTSQE